MRFLREYTQSQLRDFERMSPTRHKVLRDFVDKWSTNSIFDRETDNSNYLMAITLPNEYDYGIAMCSVVRDGKVEILDSVMF